MPFEGIGVSVRRKEDVRFLSGRGNYTDDINRPNQLHAYIRRSDRPHATINGIDTAAAKQAPGVVAVFTGADMAADNIGGLPCGWQIHNKDGSPMAEPPHPVLAQAWTHRGRILSWAALTTTVGLAMLTISGSSPLLSETALFFESPL